MWKCHNQLSLQFLNWIKKLKQRNKMTATIIIVALLAIVIVVKEFYGSEAIKKFVEMSTGDKEQIKNLYNTRDIEK